MSQLTAFESYSQPSSVKSFKTDRFLYNVLNILVVREVTRRSIEL